MARRGKPLKRFERTLRGPMFTWLTPGENESATSRRLATCRSLLTILSLLSAFCLLPSAFSQSDTPLPQAQPSPTLAPSPSPSPTPPPNLHQWGAVTLCRGFGVRPRARA